MLQDLWTVGHSTRSFPDFLALLHAGEIRVLVDVRRYPVSRRHPQFNMEALSTTLPDHGIEYRPMGDLGGRRKALPDSVNRGWRNESFRGYADYMQTDAFRQVLEDLLSLAAAARTAIMCAEAVPWRCHRSLISDAVVSRGWKVHHILSRDQVDPHTLCAFAKTDGSLLTYPAPDGTIREPRLF